MFDLWLIGIGTGNPDHMTFQGAKALKAADLVLVPRKGGDKTDLVEVRRVICRQVRGDDATGIQEFDMPTRDATAGYLDGVNDWHDAIAKTWQAAIAASGQTPASVALLIWGDPSLYDSALRIAGRLAPQPNLHVVPGVTALQALTAAHCIPLNDLGAPFLITTGRRLREDGWPEGYDRIAVMLDGGAAFQELPGAGFDIWWGAYLGMPSEIAIKGRLKDVSAEILEVRTRARAEHGWIMDVYILERRR